MKISKTLLIMVVSLVTLIWALQKSTDSPSSRPSQEDGLNSEASPSVSSNASSDSNPTMSSPGTNSTPSANDSTTSAQEAPASTPSTIAILEKLNLESEKNRTQFLESAHLDLKLPEGMRFSPLDLGDDMVALSAKSPGEGGLALSLVAAPLTPSLAEVQKFLSENQESIPSLKGASLTNWGKPTEVPPPSSSGLKKVTLISASSPNGSQQHAVLLQRADGKGSYLLIATGQAAFFDENDGLFDSVLESVRAKPMNSR